MPSLERHLLFYIGIKKRYILPEKLEQARAVALRLFPNIGMARKPISNIKVEPTLIH